MCLLPVAESIQCPRLFTVVFLVYRGWWSARPARWLRGSPERRARTWAGSSWGRWSWSSQSSWGGEEDGMDLERWNPKEMEEVETDPAGFKLTRFVFFSAKDRPEESNANLIMSQLWSCEVPELPLRWYLFERKKLYFKVALFRPLSSSVSCSLIRHH